MDDQIHEKSTVEIKMDFIQKDIEEIRGSLSDFTDSMKDISKAITKIAVQEERVTTICTRLDKAELSCESAWASIRDIKIECNKRQQHVDWAVEQQKNPPKQPESWWDEKIGKGTGKIFWGTVIAVIAYAVGKLP